MRLSALVFVIMCLPLLAQQQNDPATPNIGLKLPEFDAPNWDTPLNANFLLIDKYLSGGKAIPALTITGPLTAGSISGLSSLSITGALGFIPLNPTNNLNDLSNKTTALTNLGAQPTGNYLTGLNGDVDASGPGLGTATLSPTGVASGTYGDATHSAQITVDIKGRITSATSVPISGSGGSGGAEFYSQGFTCTLAPCTVSIAHNLNSLNIVPTVYDSSGKVIGYTDFTLVDANNAILTLATDISGTVRLMTSSGGVYSQSFTNATSVAVTHNLGTEQLLATVYNSSNVAVGYSDLTPTDVNDATLTFATPQSGRIVIVNP